MPKAARQPRSKNSRKEPIARSTAKTKDPKASHLYTDDNPATTIHGTGFKDSEAAYRTLDLIKGRSLTYQFQTVNTMYHRAKHHPSMKSQRTDGKPLALDSSAGMREAMDIFRQWLDVTYQESKSAARADGFKPLLSKACVKKYLPQIDQLESIPADVKQFAHVYVALPKGKRLGNVLVNDDRPTEADWERKRYAALSELVPDGREKRSSWSQGELWDGESSGKVTHSHLELIAWAWSPIGEKSLL